MNSLDFVYWLQGFFELSENKKLTKKQVLIIKDHIALVLSKVTPERTGNLTFQEIMEKMEVPRKYAENPPPLPYLPSPFITTKPTSTPFLPGIEGPTCSVGSGGILGNPDLKIDVRC